jgi:hypothetical protein
LISRSYVADEPNVRWEDKAEPMRLLAQGVLDIFGEALPCGWETPRAEGGLVNIPSDLCAHLHVFKLEPQEALAIAAAIVRAAVEAAGQAEARR